MNYDYDIVNDTLVKDYDLWVSTTECCLEPDTMIINPFLYNKLNKVTRWQRLTVLISEDVETYCFARVKHPKLEMVHYDGDDNNTVVKIIGGC